MVLGVSHSGLYSKERIIPEICELSSETSEWFTPCNRAKSNSLTSTRGARAKTSRWP